MILCEFFNLQIKELDQKLLLLSYTRSKYDKHCKEISTDKFNSLVDKKCIL